MSYLFTHEDKIERERLAAIEAGLDPSTIENLETIGVREGWHCLEVGAGGGSIALWLCRRVGSRGKVVAADLQTKFLEAIDAPNLEVRRYDVTKEEIEPRAFDLVMARKVLEHLRDPVAALVRMAAALKPGGWMLVEDTDLASCLDLSRRTRRIAKALLRLRQSSTRAPRSLAVRCGPGGDAGAREVSNGHGKQARKTSFAPRPIRPRSASILLAVWRSPSDAANHQAKAAGESSRSHELLTSRESPPRSVCAPGMTRLS